MSRHMLFAARQILLLLVIVTLGATGIGTCANAAAAELATAALPCADMTMADQDPVASSQKQHPDQKLPGSDGTDDCARKCHGPAFAAPFPRLSDQPMMLAVWHAAPLSHFTGIDAPPATPPPRVA